MKTTSKAGDLVREALLAPPGGIVGMVDSLLAIDAVAELRITWQTDSCRVQLAGADAGEVIEVPMLKSVFRALLARVAELCNKRDPNSVSPYGGKGTLIGVGARPSELSVTMVNTADEQSIQITANIASPAVAKNGAAGQLRS